MNYFDYCATTPLDHRVRERMAEVERSVFGNPSSIHRFGQEARGVVEEARREAAAAFGCEAAEILFTSGGTEANNHALWQCLRSANHHCVLSAIEHPSVRETATRLAPLGLTATSVPIDREGVTDPEAIHQAIRPDTGLVTVMLVNNEIGTIQPIRKIAEICRETGVWLHCDAVQAPGKIAVNLHDLGVTSASFSAHKFYGPKGVGALFVAKGSPLRSLLAGGGQEGGRRAGTENVSGIAGLGLAAILASRGIDEFARRAYQLEERLLHALRGGDIAFVINGAKNQRAPGILNLSFPGIASATLAIRLDLDGIAVSTGSACSSGSVTPSPTLKAMGLPDADNLQSIRISLGRPTTVEEIDLLAAALLKTVRALAISTLAAAQE